MALTRNVTVTGLDEVLRKLSSYGKLTREAAATAIYEEARAIEQASVTKYVPVDTGQLRGDMAFVDESATVSGDKVRSSSATAAPTRRRPREPARGPHGRRESERATLPALGECRPVEIRRTGHSRCRTGHADAPPKSYLRRPREQAVSNSMGPAAFDVAWLAGLLEGEGCFSPSIVPRGKVSHHKARMENGRMRPARTVTARKDGGTAHVSLWMSDADVVARAVKVAARVTGMPERRIYERQCKPAKGYHNPPKKGYRADWCGECGVILMRAIRPYMGVRRGIAIDRQLELFGKQQALMLAIHPRHSVDGLPEVLDQFAAAEKVN